MHAAGTPTAPRPAGISRRHDTAVNIRSCWETFQNWNSGVARRAGSRRARSISQRKFGNGPCIYAGIELSTVMNLRSVKLLNIEKIPRRIGYYAPRPFLLLRRVLILRHCDALVTNFTAAKFRALYCNSDGLDQMERVGTGRTAHQADGDTLGPARIKARTRTAFSRRLPCRLNVCIKRTCKERKALQLKQLMIHKMCEGGDARDHANKFSDIVDRISGMDIKNLEVDLLTADDDLGNKNESLVELVNRYEYRNVTKNTVQPPEENLKGEDNDEEKDCWILDLRSIKLRKEYQEKKIREGDEEDQID
ncbi:hypothetical protein EVAR_20019_1 [Eumeta japonica]|uniref:Uncharacterized protein n=1 Tax=Eumeta variegata TaxID=151549 RepID=A0A4C1VA37_EUMVA|nr:hypothetical protein EVAR_20019_1 [Eumeta japonica]